MDENRNETIENLAKYASSIFIDTRTIKKGEVFIAIKGKRFDGHDFVEEAFKKGAKLAIVSRRPKNLSLGYKDRLIKVKDTVKALGDIAKTHRLKFNVPVIAITGSNGKTTTKEMVTHVLSAKYNVLKNETSKNNLIGLPLTLLELEEKHSAVVLEMGMNHLGEIDRLSEIAKPHIGVITNIAPAHLEFLYNLKNVFIAKSELIKRLSREDTAILNKDDIYLRNIKGISAKKVYFGIDRRCPFQTENLLYRNNMWHFSIDKTANFELHLLGRHNIYNALVAIVIARQFDMCFSTIAERIKSYRQICPMRLEFRNIRGVEILDDSYNSNPRSLECAINTLAEYDTDGRRIVVSGDMLELGKQARAMHQSLGKTLAAGPIDGLVTLGPLSKFMNKEAKRWGMNTLYHAKSHNDAASFLKKITRPGDVILVKGSRAMEMEKVIEEFR